MTLATVAPRFADAVWYGRGPIRAHERVARDTYRLELSCPEIARRVLPGQFVMLRLADCNDPLLARPLALYDTHDDARGEPASLSVVYLVAGKFTTRLARLPVGEPLEIWGPLGNGFEPQPTRHLLMVAGGIGQTPFLAAASEALGLRQYGAPPRQPARCDLVTLLYGARSADYLAGLDDFRRLGVQLRLSTDDGSAGRRGFVTDLLAEELRAMSTAQRAATRVDCCGPEPMMHCVAETCGALGVACRVSLETPMACGVGVCFTCVARIRTPDGGWDYRRTCVEGPVFDAALVDF